MSVLAHILAHAYELLGPCFKTGQLEPAILTPHNFSSTFRYQTHVGQKFGTTKRNQTFSTIQNYVYRQCKSCYFLRLTPERLQQAV